MAMKLRAIEIELADEPLPDAAGALIKESSDRVDAFMEAHKDSPVAGFVPSDFALAYASLLHIRRTMLASGDAFCEWGSGIGSVTCLAGMLGYDAIGIEFDPDLTEAAEGLADDFDVSAQFVCGSFVPIGGEHFTDRPQEAAWLHSGGLDAYEQLGLDADDFDIIYAYPWPGEEQVIFDLFKRYAAVGALLVTYHGIDDIRVQRKVAGHK